MTYKGKRAAMIMVIGAILLVMYVLYILFGNPPGSEDLKEWAILILKFLVSTVVIHVVAQIIYHIAYSIGIVFRENSTECNNVERIITSSTMEDEMDKLIGLKASRAGQAFAGIGFILMILTLALDFTAAFALNAMFISLIIGSIAEGGVNVYLYERGVKNG